MTTHSPHPDPGEPNPHHKDYLLISGRANRPLAEKIAHHLGLTLAETSIKTFPDGEMFTEIKDNVRGRKVFVIQPIAPPANDSLMELLVILDALRRSSAAEIAAVTPYYGYARQDRKTEPRTPITAKLVADLIHCAGANRLLTLDLHAGQIQGFFNIPVDNLFAAPVFVHDIKTLFAQDSPMVVSPDVGGVVRARALAKRIGGELAIIDKRRARSSASKVMNVIGDPRDRHCILIDDIADSAGTIVNAAHALKQSGARTVRAYVSHGVLSPGACQRLEDSVLEEFIVTDSMDIARHAPEFPKKTKKIRVLSITALLAQAIDNIARYRSVSFLFDHYNPPLL